MTMHKILMAASAAFLLVGCTQVVPNGDIAAAALFCEDKGGINHLRYGEVGGTRIYCQNGDMNTVWNIIKQRQLASSRSVM